MINRCLKMMILPTLLLVLTLPSIAEGDGNCRFTFSTAVVVASGYSKNPLFDITKPETLHPLGLALRHELIDLGKNPKTDNIDALHAQLPQIIKWVEELPPRIELHEKFKDNGEYRERSRARARFFPQILADLKNAYQYKRMTYQLYLEIHYKLAKLSTVDRGRDEVSQLNATARRYSDDLRILLKQDKGIALASFTNDPSHLDFILSLGTFFWVVLKTGDTRDMDELRNPEEHLNHDYQGHGSKITWTLSNLSPYEGEQLFTLKNFYLTEIRPRLAESRKPFGDAIMAHLFHGEFIYLSRRLDDPSKGLEELITFASSGKNDPFIYAAKEIKRLRSEYVNYRQELQGEPQDVNQTLDHMAIYLRHKFIDLMGFSSKRRIPR